MSSYVYMKVLESTPLRYDRGMRILSMGRIDEAYRMIAAAVAAPGKRVLDIGCGTGGVSLACAARGADVIGIDFNPGMLEVARAKAKAARLDDRVQWMELGAAEVEDRFDDLSLDAVVACLVFSEMEPEEQAYLLKVAHSRLKPGGRLLIADEVVPRTRIGRLRHGVLRLFLVIVAYILTQTVTHPLKELGDRVRKAGFVDVEETRLWGGDFMLLQARRSEVRR